MRIYAAVGVLRAAGQFGELTELTPVEVYRVDAEGVRSANVLLAWLDGPSIDDGTACASRSPADCIMRPDGPRTDRQVALGGAVLQDP